MQLMLLIVLFKMWGYSERLGIFLAELEKPLEDVPSITLSVGAAFSDAVKEQMSLFRCADVALYEVKNQGGNGLRIYGLDTREDEE